MNNIICNSASVLTINLPALSGVGDGRTYNISNHNAGTATLDPDSSETITGPAGPATTLDVAAAEWVAIISDNSNSTWRLLQKGALI